MNPTHLLVACLFAEVASAALAEPVRWTPAALSTEEYESSLTFTPDGRELFFMRADKGFQHYRLLWSRCEAAGWSQPVPPPFASPAPILEGDPFVTADGKRVYFISSRHAAHAGGESDDLDIWYADRLPTGAWATTAKRLPEPVNSSGAELLPRVTSDGSLYFGSSRPGGKGESDIYLAKQNHDGGWSVAGVAEINSPISEYEADVSLDGRRLIVVADRGDRSHLYFFTRENTSSAWIEQRRLPALPSVFQVGPIMSPSGDRVLFAQSIDQHSGEIFQLDLAPHPTTSWPPTCQQ